MCSISGLYNYHTDLLQSSVKWESILSKMCGSLAHRGPDAKGTLLLSHCGFAHTRLSIIDLDGGQQPMSRSIEGHDFHIIFNGEIYNLPSLRKEVLKHGYTPATKSDTEILLLSYMAWGPEFIKKVDGIFAIAIYDARHDTLTLYRDAFGVKPLFYTVHDGTFLFSSEIKGLFCYPHLPHHIGKEGLNELLSLGPARNPGAGIFENLHECLPGNYITVSPWGLHATPYFRLASAPHTDSYETTIEKTTYLVTNAIEKQMVSDVPICTFLSGGIDSSLVSSVCANALRKKGAHLSTFSFDFTENHKYFQANRFQPSEDRPYVEKMVDYLASDHTYLQCSDEQQADLLLASVDAHDLPCMVDIDSSLLYFCRQVSQTHKVVLTGECADEVFGGYPWFHQERFLTGDTFPWTPDLTPRKSILQPELVEVLEMDAYVHDSYNRAVSEIDILPEENELETSRRQIGYLNIRYFMQTLLNRMDRTSMWNGLEARVPFADTELVQYIFNVPWEMKAKGGLVKNVLRQAARGLLPDEILFRKKSPYPKTYNPYYETLLAGKLREVLQNSDSPICPLINLSYVEQFLSSPKDYGVPWYGQLMAGPQMIAYLLQLNYFLEKYHVVLHI